MSLGDGHQVVVWDKKHQACDAVAILLRQVGGDACAKGLADDIDLRVSGQQIECFIGGSKKTLQTRRAVSGAVAGVFENINVDGGSGVDWVCKVTAVDSASGVSMDDQDCSSRSCRCG